VVSNREALQLVQDMHEKGQMTSLYIRDEDLPSKVYEWAAEILVHLCCLLLLIFGGDIPHQVCKTMNDTHPTNPINAITRLLRSFEGWLSMP
jgi:hypothetical protein